MIRKKRQFRVGLLVLMTSALFLGMLSFIVGSSLKTELNTHYIHFDESVKGMVVGSKVNFQGVPIGAVSDIRFDAGRTLVQIRIDPEKADLQRSTVARINRLLVTGQVTIELEGFDSDEPPLPDGGEIAATRSDPINELKSGLPGILAKVDALLDESTATLARLQMLMSDDNIARVSRILDNVERTTTELPGATQALTAEAREALASIGSLGESATAAIAEFTRAAEAGTQSATRLVDTTEAEMQKTLAAARSALESLDQVQRGLMSLTSEAEGILGGNRQEIRALLVGARDAMREMQALARTLRRAPSSLLFGADSAEIVVPASPAGGRE